MRSAARGSADRAPISAVDRAYGRVLQLVEQLGLRPGDRLHTEAELSDLFGVSRSTVREALRRLEQEGVVVAVQGQGRFISASASLSLERPMTKYESITEMLAARGYAVTSAVLDVSEGDAAEPEAEALELAPGDPVIRLLRIRFGDDQPLVVSENTIPRELLPGPIEYRDWSGSLTAALAAHGQHVRSSLATISAAELPQGWRERHGLEGLGPWLLVTEVGLTKEGRRVLYARDYHRGDEISFSVLRQR
ncbi:GntR family transcriptional regulator [Leucobacter sp. wl10]|uniref:GntR family transcriptional regulator n=1 Tax=Leucobacter sp. wl10 TaxID=2304677 RepID=UPI000E5AB843|nr:GntR family transcriptional regulator [Leucobacter sp. wl10]RGE21962.1 GntR family transcriptional regulator [Leucobacter sp. wl10]